jgi:hypothetical protein
MQTPISCTWTTRYSYVRIIALRTVHTPVDFWSHCMSYLCGIVCEFPQDLPKFRVLSAHRGGRGRTIIVLPSPHSEGYNIWMHAHVTLHESLPFVKGEREDWACAPCASTPCRLAADCQPWSSAPSKKSCTVCYNCMVRTVYLHISPVPMPWAFRRSSFTAFSSFATGFWGLAWSPAPCWRMYNFGMNGPGRALYHTSVLIYDREGKNRRFTWCMRCSLSGVTS